MTITIQPQTLEEIKSAVQDIWAGAAHHIQNDPIANVLKSAVSTYAAISVPTLDDLVTLNEAAFIYQDQLHDQQIALKRPLHELT